MSIGSTRNPQVIVGQLLSYVAYAAGTDTTLHTQSTNTLTDMDATNVAVTFTAPSSGNVLIHTTGMHDQSTTGDTYWGLRESTTTIKEAFLSNPIAAGFATRYISDFYITGLTSGSVHTYKLAHRVTAGTIHAYSGPTYGQYIMEVWDAGQLSAITASTNLYPPYLNYQDQKAQNTSGGTFTTGAWRTRDLNTEVNDAGDYGSLASNQITLVAGTYRIRAEAPAYFVFQHQARLQNVTDSVTVLVGQTAYSDRASDGSETNSVIAGEFTIAAGKALEIQHQCVATQATNGLGVACNFTTEIFTIVELWKVG